MITLAAVARNAAANAIAQAVDAGAAPGRFLFYTAGFATLLATAVCPATSFAAAFDGSAALSAPIVNVAVIATGDGAAFSLTDGDGTTVLSGSVGVTDSGSDITFDAVNWSAGDLIDVPGFTITTPAS